MKAVCLINPLAGSKRSTFWDNTRTPQEQTNFQFFPAVLTVRSSFQNNVLSCDIKTVSPMQLSHHQ